MIICGIKLSHDGGVAVIDGQKLAFSIEIEKLRNHRRYSELGDLRRVEEVLQVEGVDPSMIDQFVIDGWWTGSRNQPSIATANRGTPVEVPVGFYTSDTADDGLLHRYVYEGIPSCALRGGYVSYSHASNHVFGSYCTSPFAAFGEPALVLAWDGGMLPRVYRISPSPISATYMGLLFPLIGNTFTEFCKSLDPFRPASKITGAYEQGIQSLEVPGKAMAYAALGICSPAAFLDFQKLLDELDPMEFGASIGEVFSVRRAKMFEGMSNADLIATFQDYLGKLLVDSLAAITEHENKGRLNLCLSGGCALNIKWNSLIRASGLFADVWVPPFPNDSGAAIGTACCEMVRQHGQASLDWNVYSGPRLQPGKPAPGWTARRCDETEIARVLYEQGEPVVVLDGRAELGPRALGNRSILAPATRQSMKDRLNKMKERASYRPVAPICIESEASKIFEPGTADPYMLFEHRLRPGWASRVPAIAHVDGSARLQTIEPSAANTPSGRVLSEYWKLSGIPVLCNTSANLAGCGFFPDVESATRWGRTSYVWSDGMLYTRKPESTSQT